MSIKLTYTTKDDEEKTVEFQRNIENIDLKEMEIRTINLTPLEFCTKLQKLDLQDNQLETIDLTPLSSCRSLKNLVLHHNQLQEIDLSPLSSCINIEILGLISNRLQHIDLAPLSNCINLRGLFLDQNQILSIDTTPLVSNSVIKIDKTCNAKSWLKWGTIDHGFIYERPNSTYTWSFLHQVVQKFGNDRRVLHDILYALGLGSYGFIGRDIRKNLVSISSDTPIENVREEITTTIVDKVISEVDRKGTTTGLVLEELVTRHSEIALRVQQIVELREAEIQTIQVGVSDSTVDLRDLWVTAYGYEILLALNMGLTTTSVGFDEIMRAFNKLGFHLKTGETSSTNIKMSKVLKNTIWWLVENRSKPWIAIKKKQVT